jgi:hypothetical protein
MNPMSSIRSSKLQVPVPDIELACHCKPMICVRVGATVLAGLKPLKGAVIVIGVVVNPVIADAGYW